MEKLQNIIKIFRQWKKWLFPRIQWVKSNSDLYKCRYRNTFLVAPKPLCRTSQRNPKWLSSLLTLWLPFKPMDSAFALASSLNGQPCNTMQCLQCSTAEVRLIKLNREGADHERSSLCHVLKSASSICKIHSIVQYSKAWLAYSAALNFPSLNVGV